MLRTLFPAVAVAVFLGAQPAKAQYDLPISRPAAPRADDDPKPVYKYELKPEHGQFLISVKTFRGTKPGDKQVKELAEGLAEYIRAECRLYAFVHESGWLLRQERRKEKELMEAEARKYYQARGYSEEAMANELRRYIKMVRLPDEYTVLVAPGKGTLKDLEEARAFAQYVRKLPAPPAEFCDAVIVGTDRDVARKHGDPVNPFLTAFYGHNPTLPKKDLGGLQRPKADDFLMSLNAGKPNSLIHKTTKDWTLVVQAYGPKFAQVVRPGEAGVRDGKSDGELLERAAHQAHLIADVLRRQEPPFDAYVLHTRYESFVCVGEYDSKDDRRLLANAEALRGMQIKDKKDGQVLDTLMAKPLPGMIPRP